MTDEGRKSPRVDRVTGSGKHDRHAARVNGSDKVDTTIGVLVPRKPKHRYVFLHGSRRQRAEMRAALRYDVREYPKGESSRYDATKPIAVQLSFGSESVA